jgi:hypothetical protein
MSFENKEQEYLIYKPFISIIEIHQCLECIHLVKNKHKLDFIKVIKVKFTLEQAMKSKRVGENQSYTVSVVSALDGVGGQRHTPSALHPRKKHGTSFTGGCERAEGRSGRMRTVPASIK